MTSSAVISFRRAIGAYLIALAVFIASIIFGAAKMPARVATHFNSSGVANGWSARVTFEARFALIGILLPLFPVGICYLMRFGRPEFLNVPNAAYWRAPANHPVAVAVIFGRSMWLAVGLTVWAAGFNCAIVQANTTNPPHLTLVGWVAPMVILLVFVIGWGISLARFFARPQRL